MADEVSKEEKIGYHKGSLATLQKEREELNRIVGIVDHLIQMHTGALKELGVEEAETEQKERPQRRKPIDEIL